MRIAKSSVFSAVIIISVFADLALIIAYALYPSIFLLVPTIAVVAVGAALSWREGKRLAVLAENAERAAEEADRRTAAAEALTVKLESVLRILAEQDAVCAALTDSARAARANLPNASPVADFLRAFIDTYPLPASAEIAKLRTIGKCGRLAEPLRFIEMKIPYVRELLTRVTAHSEAAVLLLSEKFTSILDKSGDTEREAKVALGALTSDVASERGLQAITRQIQETYRDGAQVVNEFLRINAENESRVKKLSTLVEESETLLHGIEEIAEQSKLIAFNLAVESAKIGKSGLGFKVICGELQRLNNQTLALSSNITTIIDSFKKNNAELSEQWLAKSRRLTGVIQGDQAKSALLEKELSDSQRIVSNLVSTVAASATSINQAISDILESMQFQDITRQQIESVQSFLKDMGNELAEVGTSLPDYGRSADERKMHQAIREKYGKQVKVSSDQEIFDLLPRRLK